MSVVDFLNNGFPMLYDISIELKHDQPIAAIKICEILLQIENAIRDSQSSFLESLLAKPEVIDSSLVYRALEDLQSANPQCLWIEHTFEGSSNFIGKFILTGVAALMGCFALDVIEETEPYIGARDASIKAIDQAYEHTKKCLSGDYQGYLINCSLASAGKDTKVIVELSDEIKNDFKKIQKTISGEEE